MNIRQLKINRLPGWLLGLVMMLTVPALVGASNSSKGSLPTYLLMGQSNMAGWGDYSALDQKWAKSLEDNKKIHFCSTNTHWEVASLKPSPRAVEQPYKVNGTFGPEYSFIDTISRQHPDEDILILKHAVGGTTLFAAWDKEWTMEKAKLVREDARDIKHRLYTLLLDKIPDLKAYAKQKGYSGIDIKSVLLVQGESDARFEFSATAYEDNLVTFIQNLRQDLPNSDFKFVLFQVNSMRMPYIETARKAQEAVASNLDDVFIVHSSDQQNPQDFPKYDDVHYNGEGLLSIGKALAAEIQASRF